MRQTMGGPKLVVAVGALVGPPLGPPLHQIRSHNFGQLAQLVGTQLVLARVMYVIFLHADELPEMKTSPVRIAFATGYDCCRKRTPGRRDYLMQRMCGKESRGAADQRWETGYHELIHWHLPCAYQVLGQGSIKRRYRYAEVLKRSGVKRSHVPLA